MLAHGAVDAFLHRLAQQALAELLLQQRQGTLPLRKPFISMSGWASAQLLVTFASSSAAVTVME
jgi:hypothetical protein